MKEFRRNFSCMGTVFQFVGRSEKDVDAALDLACERLRVADEMFSLYKPESPLSRLARGETSLGNLPQVVSEIWDECEKWEKLTDGWFSSMTKENTFDPSGYVKAWATNQAAASLLENSVTDFAINAGGDILLSPDISPGLPKRIGIANAQSIAESTGAVTVIDLNETEYLAVATSGTAERGEHIWNPKTHSVANELAQVSVVAKDLITADVLATAMFASGMQVERLIKKFADEVQVLVITNSGDVFTTPGFGNLVRPV